MSIAGDTQELIPGPVFRDGDESTRYWIRNGKVMFGSHLVRGAHVDSFRFYRGYFAKDRNNCYGMNSKFTGGNGSTFRALNFTYATDGRFVWTFLGQVKDADAASFVVCDDGVFNYPNDPNGHRAPHGFGKDKTRVYYFDSDGKPNWVRKAAPASFVSLNDGFFGKDANFAFFGRSVLPKADVSRWRPTGGYYSADDSRVYWTNRQIREAHAATFEVLPGKDIHRLAKDKDRYYSGDKVLDAAEFAKWSKVY
jgi:DKNYY family